LYILLANSACHYRCTDAFDPHLSLADSTCPTSTADYLYISISSVKIQPSHSLTYAVHAVRSSTSAHLVHRVRHSPTRVLPLGLSRSQQVCVLTDLQLRLRILTSLSFTPPVPCRLCAAGFLRTQAQRRLPRHSHPLFSSRWCGDLSDRVRPLEASPSPRS
jgi:hypothetical protein